MNLLELARSLDIVETIKLNAGRLTNSKQHFKHLIIIDFEATCWNKGEAKWRQPEIIEFPAILVDLSTQKIISEFHQYILPIESPKLSDFCIKLTGISQEKIDKDSIPLQSGLINFGQWLNESIDKYKLVLPKSVDKNSGTTAFITWSDWDFGVCLAKECERKRIKKPQYFDQWIDLKATFKDWYKYRPKNFADALKFVGMVFEGREHSGIDDARNIARLACRLVHDGAPLAITTDLPQTAIVVLGYEGYEQFVVVHTPTHTSEQHKLPPILFHKTDSMDSSDSEDSVVINFCDDSNNDGEDDSDNIADNSILESRNNNNKPFLINEYELLSQSDLICRMKKDVYKIVNILIVSEPVARCLLNHYKWNKDQLLNDYYNADDLNVFFQTVGIDNPSATCNDFSVQITDCQICFTPFSESKATFFGCGHQFCVNSCCQYFQAKVLNDGEGNIIKCPDPDCKILVDDATLMALVPENVKHRFEKLITQTFVLSNPTIRFCRSAGCEYAIQVQKVKPFPVICKCGYESCFQCGELWHETVTCALLKKWIQCSMEDIESYQWIQENAKKCPQCTVNIEKNGGCNHMRCRSCHHEFCWLCMANWKQHGRCNQFEQNGQNITQRLVHYSRRYNNHIKSIQLERGLYNSVESKMKEWQGMASLTRNEVLFLKCAVDSLRQSRQMLISTYVFAYYSKKSNQLLMFEDNQRDLEIATENLSWTLEQDITNETMVQLKQKLQEKYTYCDKRRDVLLDHIREGYEKGYWSLED